MFKIREIIVPLAVVAMIIGMMLPLPTVLLDVLLIINLLLAVALLLSALSVNDPLKLSALPTILLLATLYRLTLNISTTRLILSGGEAGQVVAAFGSVVIGGSLAVGLVVFLIITLIQFIVIAKGAERIAEVAARFTLDALPGKQMSVDADVRSGLIDITRAREKREELQVESRFYGALDGAMKFVKGDAIAGLVIVAINITGGICVGVFVDELTVAAAVQKFVTLTVGDGLVSQIPALLNSLTAGIIVTKVARNENSSVVHELLAQIGQGEMVRGIIGAVALLLGFLPGMPAFPFLLVGIALLLCRSKKERPVSLHSEAAEFRPRSHPVLAISLHLSNWSEVLAHGGSNDAATIIKAAIDSLRQDLFDEFGILLTRIDVIKPTEKTPVEDSCAIVLLRGSEIARIALSSNAEGWIVLLSQRVREAIVANRVDLIDDMHTRRVLESAESVEQAAAIIPAIITVTQLTVILRALVRDGISIRNLDVILQAIAESSSRAAHERHYLEEVRIALGRQIVSRFISGGGVLEVIGVDPLVDLMFSQAERGQKSVDHDLLARVIEFAEESPTSRPLIVSRGSRALLADAFRTRGINRAVFAFEEVPGLVALEMTAIFQLGPGENELFAAAGELACVQ